MIRAGNQALGHTFIYSVFSYKLRAGAEDIDGHSSYSDFDAATSAARSPTPSSAPTPLPGAKKLIRDPTGYTGVIQISLISQPSGLSEAAKAVLDPAQVWYIGREPKEDDGRLSLTNSLEKALRVKFENQRVLKITVSIRSQRQNHFLTEDRVRTLQRPIDG